MEPPRSTSRSRRSYPNLNNLSIAPLSAQYPLDASVPPSPDEQGTRTPRTSYIAQKSAPTTPGVLSLSQSRSSSRQRPTKTYAYHGSLIDTNSEVREAGDIPKAKSTSVLQPGVSFVADTANVGQVEKQKRRHTRKSTAPLPLRSPLTRHHTKESNDEWLHRAGLAIAGETRDSKGQGWLVRRESSTSLVGQTDDCDQHHHPPHDDRRMALLSGEHLADADYPVFFSPRISRAGSRFPSRMGSRVPSARPSRRGSRAGSRVDLMTGLGTSKSQSQPQSARHSLDMSELEEGFIEPDFIEADFIEADEDSEGDDEEIARLTREHGSGLGGWMDRLIGWSLFSVDEDEEASETEDDDDDDDNDDAEDANRPSRGSSLRLDNLSREERKLRREVEAKRRKLEREAIVAASALTSQRAEGTATDGESRPSTAGDAEQMGLGSQEAGAWQDAAWLLSVASKALF